MRFARGAKIGLDAQVHLNVAAGKPAAASFGQLRRFAHLRHSEHAAEKCARVILASGRHCQLHLIDRGEGHVYHSRAFSISAGDICATGMPWPTISRCGCH